MSLHEELLGTSYMRSDLLRDFDLGSPEAQEGNHPAVPLEPSLYQLVLVAVGDPSHLLHLLYTVPPLIHTQTVTILLCATHLRLAFVCG